MPFTTATASGRRKRGSDFRRGSSMAKQIAVEVAIGWAALVSVLVLVGVILTYFAPLQGVRDWDLSISKELADSRSTTASDLATFISRRGDTLAVIGLAAVITVCLAVVRRGKVLAFVPTALAIEVTIFLAVNYIVQRPRPGVAKVGSVPSTYSFPSGHIAATLVCWLGVALLFRYFGRPSWARVTATVGSLVALAMGWARVYLGMHHFLDVVIGALMGLAVLLVAARAFRMLDIRAQQWSGQEPRSAPLAATTSQSAQSAQVDRHVGEAAHGAGVNPVELRLVDVPVRESQQRLFDGDLGFETRQGCANAEVSALPE
jgi:membrane-associated phospholipid phosphatase